MAIWVDSDTRLVVQGITGTEGQFHALGCRDYGTQVVAGVTPGKGGQSVEGIPVYDSVAEALRGSYILRLSVFAVGGALLVALLGGIVLCLTIIGIPFGIQCFKLAGGVLAPFGREVRETEPPGGALALIMNIIWIILPGLELAIMHLLLAAFFALTIVGIPLAMQHIKLLPLALLPFGRVVRDIDTGRQFP
jgi:uncharacterized membrane protein YccF (DUF307 family)